MTLDAFLSRKVVTPFIALPCQPLPAAHSLPPIAAIKDQIATGCPYSATIHTRAAHELPGPV
jgi:hypothetical protein